MRRLIFKKPLVLALLLVMVLFGTAGVGYVIHQMMTGPSQITDLHVDSDVALKLGGMKQVSKSNGITEWELEADTATLAKERNQAILTQVKVVFHTRDNDRIFLTADQGVLDTETHDLAFTGNVVIEHQANTLQTDKLQYKKKPHIIISESRVRLENPNAAMEADTMEIRINDNVMVLQGDVKGTFSEKFKLP